MDKFKTGKLIEHLRIKYNLTQLELGKKIGVGGTTISNYERGYSTPHLDKLLELSNVFGVDYTYFVEDGDKFVEKISQNGIFTNRIPFYKENNVNGILLSDIKLADSFISLPSDVNIKSENYICTTVSDNSMSNIGIKKSSYIIVNFKKATTNGDIALVFDTNSNKFIVRKYITDGPMIMLVSDGYGDDTTTIYTSMNDSEYKIIGPVEKAIINL